MSTFEAKVYRLTIEPHNNADSLEVARIGDYMSVVRKGQFKTGDLGIYIQEGTVVPDWLLQHMGLWKHDRAGKGMLAGSAGNRVKAAKFRGVVSQGLVLAMVQYPFHTLIDKVGRDAKGEIIGVSRPSENTAESIEAFLHDTRTEVKFAPEGTDVAEFLGLVKYEPPIPTYMSGEVKNTFGYTISYDIENIKKYNEVLVDGEEIVITEKLHGTWCCFGYHPEVGTIVTSKGLSKAGVAFKLTDANANNLYVKTLKQTAEQYLNNDVIETTFVLARTEGGALKEIIGNGAFYLLGEIFGAGVQDLRYGQTSPTFRLFDVYVGSPGSGRYLNEAEKQIVASVLNLPRVPVLYHGPYNKEIVLQLTSGKETVSGTEANMREGVVITPAVERTNEWIGRVILKSVSDEYLMRKNPEATEYQ